MLLDHSVDLDNSTLVMCAYFFINDSASLIMLTKTGYGSLPMTLHLWYRRDIKLFMHRVTTFILIAEGADGLDKMFLETAGVTRSRHGKRSNFR